MNAARLAQQLILHEGLALEVYPDTLGNMTVLVGYNLSGRGVGALEHAIGRKLMGSLHTWRFTEVEALQVLAADIARIEPVVKEKFPKYLALSEVRQRVVMDLAFNLGFKALAFKRTAAAIEVDDWSTATRELYASRWAHQVDDGPGKKFGRADRLGQMLLTGRDYI